MVRVDGAIISHIAATVRVNTKHRVRGYALGVAHHRPVKTVDTVEGGLAIVFLQQGYYSTQMLQECAADWIP